MRRHQELLRRIADDERGVSIPLVALMFVVLLGMAAFAVDLGWFYVNAAQVQRTADAGALAAVVHMPQDFPGAVVAANEVTTANGYTDGVDGVTVAVAQIPGEPNQVEVTVTDVVPTFFLKVFGIDTQTISRRARAEYVPPLPLGSPDNQFGNACDPRQSGCSGQPNFWANIHGRHTDTRMGDAYSSYCDDGTGSGNSSCPQNPTWRERGYLYGVEAQGASSFTVQFVDIEFRNDSGGQNTSDSIRTGDRGCEVSWNSGGPDCGQTVRVNLYAPDPTPLDVSDNTLLCSVDIPPVPQIDPSDPYVWTTPAGCFTVNNPSSGIYVVQVQVLDSGGNDDGLNRYSIRAVSPGNVARLYGLGDMSIYNNASGTTTQFYLAEVSDIYKGKTFVVELYDPGEANPGGTIQIMAPNGPGSWTVFAECEQYVKLQWPDPWTYRGTLSPCQFFAQSGGGPSVSDDRYNGDWIKLEITLPATYTCSANCWWKVNYNYPNAVNDTTTWRAYIVGNPVHLIPNG